MAAISIAVASDCRTSLFLINDINKPLIGLLEEAVEQPQRLVDEYRSVWKEQFSYGEEHFQHFYEVRQRFNNGDTSPANMLYLLARCVKGAVRYGKKGFFNQSPDKRRHGSTPDSVRRNVYAVSSLLKGKAVFSSLDYHYLLDAAVDGDIVYMDPPYQGVSDVRDNRYFSGVSYDDFSEAVGILDRRGIDYLISYDGECGAKSYGKDLPSDLHCKKVLLNAGLSSQALLLGKKSTTFESLYVSDSIMEKLDKERIKLDPLLEAMA